MSKSNKPTDTKDRGGLFTAAKILILIRSVLSIVKAAKLLLSVLIIGCVGVCVAAVSIMYSEYADISYGGIAIAVYLAIIALSLTMAIIESLAPTIFNLVALKKLENQTNGGKYIALAVVLLVVNVVFFNILTIVAGVFLIVSKKKVIEANCQEPVIDAYTVE